jgi:aminomethyltransferase
MDVRRIEAGILDNNTDFDSSINPYEAGLGSLVDLSKDDFIGKKSLELASQKQGKKLFGITSDYHMTHSSKVFLSNGEDVGYLTAATWSPTLKKYVGYVRFDYSGSWIDFSVKVQIQEKLIDCEIIELPFFDKEKFIPKGIDKNIP